MLPIDFDGNVPVIRFSAGPDVWGAPLEQHAFSAGHANSDRKAFTAHADDDDRVTVLRRIHRVLGHCNMRDIKECVKRGRLDVPPSWKEALHHRRRCEASQTIR